MAKLPNYNKPALMVGEQVKLLVVRGLVCADSSQLERALLAVSYYRFSAYLFPFRSRMEQGKFVSGTTFEKVWSYYRFDRKLRFLVMDAIERVEVAVRSSIVNQFAVQHGVFGYRDAANFAKPLDNVRSRRLCNSSTARRCGAMRSSFPIFEHPMIRPRDFRSGWLQR